MLIIGIDPGVTGAIACYWPVYGEWQIFEMPVLVKIVGGKKRSVYDEVKLLEAVKYHRDVVAYVEEVGGLPGQSAPRAFNFGFGCGLIKMALVAHKIPIELIRPQEWKSALRAPKDKVAYTARACELAPRATPLINRDGDKDKRSGRAAAVMLAIYGARERGLE